MANSTRSDAIMFGPGGRGKIKFKAQSIHAQTRDSSRDGWGRQDWSSMHIDPRTVFERILRDDVQWRLEELIDKADADGLTDAEKEELRGLRREGAGPG